MKVYAPSAAAKLSPMDLVEYLSQFAWYDVVTVRSAEDAYRAAGYLAKISSNRSYVLEIYKCAVVFKRQLKREGLEKEKAYQDMVDAEKLLDLTLKGLDSAYAAINKAISVHQEAQRELQAIMGRKGVNIQP